MARMEGCPRQQQNCTQLVERGNGLMSMAMRPFIAGGCQAQPDEEMLLLYARFLTASFQNEHLCAHLADVLKQYQEDYIPGIMVTF